jgi:soluble lytic murein transglycosylase-like protein
MTHAALVFACVLRAVEGGSTEDARCQTPEIREISAAITEESNEHDVKPGIIAAIMWHESRFQKYARGAKGEVGRMQLFRNGGAVTGRYRHLSFHALAQTDLNTHLGVVYLAQFSHKCATASQWLTAYNHGPGCRTSRYSAGVLKDLKMGRYWADRLKRSATSPSASSS